MTNNSSLKDKYEKYITFDEPIPFWSHSIKEQNRNDKNCLLFYPVMIRDMFDFYRYCGCLLTDHTSELDMSLPIEQAMKILSLTCYEYLYYETIKVKSNAPYIHIFSVLLSICLRDNYYKDIVLDDDNDYFLDIFNHFDNLGKPIFMINNVMYDSQDFDEIKEIIAFQNQLDLPEIEKDKRFRDARERAKKQRDRILSDGNNKIGSLEEQLICLSLGYGLSYDEVGKVSLRKFNKMISYMNKKQLYEIYLSASMSGFVEFKDKSVLKHWMTAEDDDKYNDSMMDVDKVNKIVDGNNNPQNQ